MHKEEKRHNRIERESDNTTASNNSGNGSVKRSKNKHTSSKKRYTCPYSDTLPNGCSFTSHNKYGLREHIRIHTGEKPFACGVGTCDYRSANSSNVLRHRRRKHGKKSVVINDLEKECSHQRCKWGCDYKIRSFNKLIRSQSKSSESDGDFKAKWNDSVSNEESVGKFSMGSSTQSTVILDRMSPVFFQNGSSTSDPLAILRPLEEAAQICKSLALRFPFNTTFTRTLSLNGFQVIKNTSVETGEDSTIIYKKEKVAANSRRSSTTTSSSSGSDSPTPKSRLNTDTSPDFITSSTYSLETKRSNSRGSGTDTSGTRRDSSTTSSSSSDGDNTIRDCSLPSNDSKDSGSDVSSTSSNNMINERSSKNEENSF
jgi:hypothetical protein